MQNQGMQILQHTMRALFRAVLAIFVSIPVTGIISFVVVEGVGFLVTRHFPGVLTNLLAVAFALAVAYASALTMAVLESVRGVIAVEKVIQRDFTREAGALGHVVQNLERRV